MYEFLVREKFHVYYIHTPHLSQYFTFTIGDTIRVDHEH